MQIIAKSKGRFQVRVFLGRDQSGKVITKTKTFNCGKKEIQRLAIEFETAVKATSAKREPIPITLRNLLEIYFTNRPLSPKSRYLMDRQYACYIFPFFPQDRLITDITLADGQAFVLHLKNKGLSNVTINTIMACFKLLLNYAVNNNFLDFSPLSKIPKLPVFRKFKEVLNKDELKRLLHLADSDPKYFFLRLAIVTGARPEEYLCLEWTDVNFEVGTIKIEKVAINKGGRGVRKGAKNDSSVRIIQIDVETLKILKERHKRSKSKYILPACWGGNFLAHSAAFNRLKEAAKIVGIEKKVNLYLLRHSHATLLIQNGAPISEVSQRLGHSNIHTTFSFYVHTTTEGAAKTAKLFGDLMDS